MQVRRAFEEDAAGGVVLEHLLDGRAEMIMQRGALPYTYALAAFLIKLIHLRLQYDADALHEEDTAQQGHE